MTNRILTTHVGSLPAPASSDGLGDAVAQVVSRQRQLGIDIVNEGELTKEGSWSTFMRRRLAGFDVPDRQPPISGRAFDISKSVDWIEFAAFYDAASRKGTLFEQTGTAHSGLEEEDFLQRTCMAPVTYVGQEVLQQENLAADRQPRRCAGGKGFSYVGRSRQSRAARHKQLL